MSFTVATIVSSVQRTYSMLTTSDVVGYLNEVRPDILRRLRLRNTTQNINLTADTQEYAITVPMLGATSVSYIRSADEADKRALEPTNLEALDITQPQWRNRASSEPRSYYFIDGLTGPKIGFFPKPDLTTTTGYPIVTIYYLDCNTLASGDTVYDNLLSPMLYVHAICKRYAEDRGLEDLPLREKFFNDEYKANEDYLKGRQTKSHSTRLRVKSRRISAAT